MLNYDQALRMAKAMKKEDARIQRAIRRTMKDGHGVVALVFSDDGRKMQVEILDEPFDANVRVYAG